MTQEALNLALEALEADPLEMVADANGHMVFLKDKAITAIKEALAQPEQEPKCGAIIEVFGKDWRLEYMSLPVGKHKLYTQQYTYTTPPQRTWVGLTDEEIIDVLHPLVMADMSDEATDYEIARAIEDASRRKNT